MAHDAMSLVLVALLTILFTFSTSGFAFTDEPVEPETPTAIPEPESEPAEPLSPPSNPEPATSEPAPKAKNSSGIEIEHGDPAVSQVLATGPDTENPYFSLNTTLAAPAPGNDDRGLITAHVKEYSVSNTPALKPQSGSHPFLNASIVLSNDRPADFFSEVVTIVRNQTETRYRVSQTDLNVNSLGVASNYDAYFTAQFFVQKSTRTRKCGLGGLICGSWTSWSSWANDGVRVLSIWRVNLVTNAVTQLVTRVNGYPDNMESGAVNTNDRYFFSPTTLTSTPTNSMQWTIYRLTGTAIQLSSVVTSVANSRPAGATGKGDFAFDSYNNLHIVTSGTGTTSKVATIDSSFIMETGNVNVPGVTLTDLTHPLLGAGNEIIGLAFPFDTYGVYGNREAHAIMDQANLGTILSSQTYTDDTQSDYASTVTKPKFQLKLNIPSRAVGTDQFTISAGPHGVLSSLNTTGSGTTYSLFSNPEIVDRTFYMPPWVEPNPKVSIPFSITGSADSQTFHLTGRYSPLNGRAG